MDEEKELCESCEERPGKLMIDPYREELFGEKVQMRLCEQCKQDRIDDI